MLEEHLNQLLTTNNSELARHLRHDLRGMCASLVSAQQEASSDDPGAEVCEKLIDELNQLLQHANFDREQQSHKDSSLLSNASSIELPARATNLTTSKSKLKHLRQVFLDDEILRSYLGDLQLISTEDTDLWHEVQRLLLRIPEPKAKEWRDRAQKLAQKIGADADESAVLELPYKENKLLYPGLTGTVQAKGLCLSTTAPLDPRVAEERQDGDLKFLAQVVSICLQFIEMDSSLHHCLKNVFRFGVTPLGSKEKSAYVKALIDRFRRVQKNEDDPVAALRARLDLDEAIHSLLYLPPVQTNSWWGNLQDEVRKTLAWAADRVRQPGYSVAYQWLSGAYANVNKYTQDDWALKNWGTPGEVTVCLRVYARIDQENIPGRVLFHPLG